MQTPLQPVDGIILVISCQHNIASRVRQFPTHSHYNGWKVIYDKPGYNEFYDAFYQFSKK